MGLYIKDMEMPKSCHECPLLYVTSLCDGFKDCPLSPDPPHGDLIERKAICLTDFEIAMCNGDYKELVKMLLEKIESAPTIVPASESKEYPAFLSQYELTPQNEEDE